ncbi:hypothetical protein M959_06742, partial [Chaetura pelagica]
SPTIWQIVVDSAISPIRAEFPQVTVYHYMEDILLAATQQADLLQVLTQLKHSLAIYALQIAPEKIQEEAPWKYLGWWLYAGTVFPQHLHIAVSINTLHDLQKLLGTINWVKPLLGTTTEELSPLFSLLKGEADLMSSWHLTAEAKQALDHVADKTASSHAHRLQSALLISL